MINKHTFLRLFATLFFILLLSACNSSSSSSGGTSSSTPLPSATIFNLKAAYNRIFAGSTFNLAGSDNTGTPYSASVTFANEGLTLVNGQSVTEVDSISTITNKTTNGTVSGTQTRYYQANWIPYELIQNNTGVIYTPNAFVPLPASAKIGDFGTIPTLIGSDGSKTTISWHLTSASGGNAFITFDDRRVDFSGTFMFEEADSFTVTPTGNVLALRAVITYSNGTVLTLSGSKQ